MALPKINAPTYSLTLPSSKQKIKYRPFLVKEEKLLLMAMESKEDDEMKEAVEQIIRNCSFDKLDPLTMALVDIEYMFLYLRIKSKGETAEYSFKCDACEVVNDKEANLTKVKVINKDQSNVIKLTSDIGIQMKAPSYELAGVISNDMKAESIFKVVVQSIESIYEGEEVFQAKDQSDEELMDFIESLSDAQFKEIKNYFENVPSLELDIDFTCTACKKENTLTLKGIKDFLA